MSIVDVDPYLAVQWDRWLKRRSESARDHLIVSYSPLVKFVAGRLGAGLPSHVDDADLISYGLMGLIGAIQRFEPLPHTTTAACSRSSDCTSSPHSSLTRRPEP